MFLSDPYRLSASLFRHRVCVTGLPLASSVQTHCRPNKPVDQSFHAGHLSGLVRATAIFDTIPMQRSPILADNRQGTA